MVHLVWKHIPRRSSSKLPAYCTYTKGGSGYHIPLLVMAAEKGRGGGGGFFVALSLSSSTLTSPAMSAFIFTPLVQGTCEGVRTRRLVHG